MSANLVHVTLHGELSQIGSDWDLSVKSVSEAIHAIEKITNKLYSFLIDKTRQNIKYRIVINGKDFYTDNEPRLDDPKSIENCELRMHNKNLKTIDIIPVLEGSGSKFMGWITAFLGVVLIVIGLGLTPFTGGTSLGLVMAGLTLLAAGVSTLLTKPPKFEDFREIEQGGKTSYLFAGPQNVVGEGGPVPLGYGRLLIGSQTISSSYVIRDFNTDDTTDYVRNDYVAPPTSTSPLSPSPWWAYSTYYR
jgi:predicted phage tail protein